MLLAALAASPGVAEPQAGPAYAPGAAGAGDPYFPYAWNGGYAVRRYDLDLGMGAALFGGCAASAAHVDTYSAPLPLGAWDPNVGRWVDALDVFKHEYGRWEEKTGRKLRGFSEYRFQYYGIRVKGREVVFLNAFCSDYWERAPEWRTRLVAAEGGGSCFFQAKVDVDSGSIVELTMNSEGAATPNPEPEVPRPQVAPGKK